MTFRSYALLGLLLLGACHDRPSREEALTAFRAARPGVDSSNAVLRVWADGPPWFSCAEVIAKLKSASDHAVIRDDIGHWRPLIVADWVTLRDTAAGPVVEPGWCRLTLRDSSARLGAGWREVRGDSVASGGTRRGWDVLVGRKRVTTTARASLLGPDSASARYSIIVVPNQNGAATGADRDTVEQSGLLTKVGGQWRLVRLQDEH